MERSGADLIAWYLSPGRFPAGEQWSRKHAHTQRRLCERFVAPIIGSLARQDIRVADMQRNVNAAPTAQEGGRLHALIPALVGSGIRGGYLANARPTRPAAPSPSTARSSRSAADCTGGAEEPQAAAHHLPAPDPRGLPAALADRVAARIQAARSEQEAGTNPLSLMFPSPKGRYWRANNFSR